MRGSAATEYDPTQMKDPRFEVLFSALKDIVAELQVGSDAEKSWAAANAAVAAARSFQKRKRHGERNAAESAQGVVHRGRPGLQPDDGLRELPAVEAVPGDGIVDERSGKPIDENRRGAKLLIYRVPHEPSGNGSL